MQNMRTLFEKYCGKWNALDFVLLAISYIAIITFSILFITNALSIIASLIGVLIIIITTHGKIISRYLWLLYAVIYGIIVISNQYYGELISLSIMFIFNIFCLFSWSNNQNNQVVKVKNISLLEYIISILIACLFGVALYFILRVFNTANLIISTFATTNAVLAWYNLSRRSKYTHIFFLLADVCIDCLWISLLFQGNLNNIPIVVSCTLYCVFDIIGLSNWIKLEKKQKETEQIKQC